MKRKRYEEPDLDTHLEVTEAINRIEGWCEALQSEVEVLNSRLTKKKSVRKKGFAMKRTLMSIAAILIVVGMLFAVANADYVQSDINFEIASNPELLSEYLRDTIGVNTVFRLTPTSEPSTGILEGQMYYDDTANAIYVSTDGSTWTALASASGNSLDGAYNAGSGITVDGDPVTLTVGASDNNAALQITHGETTNNNDAIIIDNSGSGNGIYIDQGEADTQGMTLEPYTSSTVAALEIDGDAHGWIGADDVGMLHIRNDVANTHAGATMLLVDGSGQPKAASEGFLARFVDTGTARTDAYAVEIETTNTTPALYLNNQMTISAADSAGTLFDITAIDTTGNSDTMTIAHSGTGDALQITCTEADSVALNLVAAADQTTSLAKFDAATSNWDGADNIGMVHIVADDPVVNTGASLLQVIQTGQPIASSEGHLARFVSSGTARTTAYAVEIETTNTTPCLMMNNQMSISAADSAGTLFDITAIDTTGNSDTMTIAHSGTGAAIKITSSEADTQLVELVSAANQTTWLQVIDGATGNWIGADNVGMLHLKADTALTHNGATQLCVINTAQPKDGAEGFLARFIDTGTARTGACAVEIETTNTTPALKLNNQLQITGADSTGVLCAITGIDTTGDTDSVTIDQSGAGNALYIDLNEADSQGITIEPFTNATVAALEVDGDTAGWLGADNVGMVHLKNDIALTHTGATMLLVDNSGQPKAASEGFLARFVDTGTARTDAYAVEIEVTNTTPALYLNGQMTISAADSAGTLFDITAIDTTGNSDTMTIAHSGTGDAIQLTCTEADSVALHAIAAASQTTSVVNIDGTTGSWIGAATTGMLHLSSDGALVADGSLLRISSTGNIAAANDGALIELVETGNAQATSYAMRIASTNNEALHVDTGKVLVDETLTATLGLQVGVGETLTADDAEGAGQTIDDDITVANVTAVTNGANDFITLPNDPTVGTVVKIMANAGSNFEVRTLESGNDKINNVDTSDGGTEYLVTNTDMVIFTCIVADNWQAVSYPLAGGVRGAVTPD